MSRKRSEPSGSAYPDKEDVLCARCGCWHWQGGRCFADDETGWPTVMAVHRETARRATWSRATRAANDEEGLRAGSLTSVREIAMRRRAS